MSQTEPLRRPIRNSFLTLLPGDWAGLSSWLSMERLFLSVSLPGGNPQHKVTYKWSRWINLLTDKWSEMTQRRLESSRRAAGLQRNGQLNCTFWLFFFFFCVNFHLGWGCRGRCLHHKTGSGLRWGGRSWEGRWRWGRERTSDGTSSPPSFWRPARPPRGELFWGKGLLEEEEIAKNRILSQIRRLKF